MYKKISLATSILAGVKACDYNSFTCEVEGETCQQILVIQVQDIENETYIQMQTDSGLYLSPGVEEFACMSADFMAGLPTIAESA